MKAQCDGISDVQKCGSFALGVEPTARDASEVGGSDLVSQVMPFAVSCETICRPCYTSLVPPSLARRQANAVEFASKVWFSLFSGSEVIMRLTSDMMRKLYNM